MIRPSKILIVDDEPFNVDYLEQELEDIGYATVSARNGREALAKVAGVELVFDQCQYETIAAMFVQRNRPMPERNRVQAYPHQLSGGMRQRVVIAMALALNPELIVMDEPTTALDVVVQREILQQVEALKRDFGFAVLFITHDVSLLLEFADRIAIMYAGELVETAPAERIGTNPQHPYTQGLLESFPPLTGPLTRLMGIPGSPPDLRDPPSGCRFHPRCPHCRPEDRTLYVRQTTERPLLREVAPGHHVACHLVADGAA